MERNKKKKKKLMEKVRENFFAVLGKALHECWLKVNKY